MNHRTRVQKECAVMEPSVLDPNPPVTRWSDSVGLWPCSRTDRIAWRNHKLGKLYSKCEWMWDGVWRHCSVLERLRTCLSMNSWDNSTTAHAQTRSESFNTHNDVKPHPTFTEYTIRLWLESIPKVGWGGGKQRWGGSGYELKTEFLHLLLLKGVKLLFFILCSEITIKFTRIIMKRCHSFYSLFPFKIRFTRINSLPQRKNSI